jgi:NADPH:quinone reductase-like Zn-dependent oxidoreductase
VSGVVEATGFGVTLFKPGDEVFGMLPYPGGAGSHAEYVAGSARAYALKPGNIDHVQAGALPLVALTAWQALADTAPRLVTQGKLRPVIADRFPLADAAKAHALGDTGHVAGKLVLTMR